MGVVQTGWAGLDARDDAVLTIGDAPHDWLFPRMAAVVHHMGAGTTGAGLRAGVPAVGLPAFGDAPSGLAASWRWAPAVSSRSAPCTPAASPN